jgi:hypothetical protein
MQLGENSGEAFKLALNNTKSFLQSYVNATEIPIMILNYGRTLHGQEYYNCVGEFLDLVPVVLKEDASESTVEEAMKKKEGTNLLHILEKTKDTDLFNDLYSKEGRGKFILWNFQGYVEKKERDIFEKVVQLLPTDMIADFVIAAGYDEMGIYVHLESSYGFEMEALKKTLSNTAFELEK